MLDIAYANLPHVLCALLLIARVGDIGTTYLVTPNLELEANPVVRKLGWPFALVTLGACFLPYVSMPAAVTALITFLLVSAGNAGKIWMVRTIGEKAYAALLIDVARWSGSASFVTRASIRHNLRFAEDAIVALRGRGAVGD